MPSSYTGSPTGAGVTAERTAPTLSIPADGDAGAAATWAPGFKDLGDEIAALKQKVAYLDTTDPFTAAQTFSGLVKLNAGAQLGAGQQYQLPSGGLSKVLVVPAARMTPNVAASVASLMGTPGAGDPFWFTNGSAVAYSLGIPLNGVPPGATVTGIDLVVQTNNAAAWSYFIRKVAASSSGGLFTSSNLAGASSFTPTTGAFYVQALNLSGGSFVYPGNDLTNHGWVEVDLSMPGTGTVQNVYAARVYYTATALLSPT